MADQTLSDLATRLLSHADNIMNPAMHEMESDLRLAATALREQDAPTPLLPRLIADLTHLAVVSRNVAVGNALRTMLGKLA
jgi:hypothetical protein